MTDELKRWLPTAALAGAGFIFVTTELMPVGLLPDIAGDLERNEARTGLLVTLYAWVVALTSLPLTMVSARLNRKRLLLVLLGWFSLSHALAATADSFAGLMAARLMTALSHALFWSVAPPLVVRVAPPGQSTRALSFLAAGISLASVLGMPLGALVGQHLGWRSAMALVGVFGLGFAVVLALFLPPTSGSPNSPERKRVPFRPNPAVRRIYLLTALTVAGHFTAFTYMRPLLTTVGGFSPPTTALLLLLVGGAGLTGALLVPRFFDRRPETSLTAALSLLSLSLLAAPWAAAFPASAVILCLAWGASMGAGALMFQTTVIQKAPEAPDLANSLYSAIFNVGIGGGALLGNRLFNGFGVSSVTLGGAALVLAAALMALWTGERKRKRSGKRQ